MTLRLIVAALAAWRMTRLLLRENGPLDIFVHYRTIVGRWKHTEKLTTCVYCLSVWVGLVTGIVAFTRAWVVLVPLALSAVVIKLDAHV